MYVTNAIITNTMYSFRSSFFQMRWVFRVAMRIKNIGKQTLSTRIGHLVEPQELRDYLDLVDCGFILPVRLQPGTEEEFVTTYLLRGTLPEAVRHLSVTYAVTSSPLESVKP